MKLKLILCSLKIVSLLILFSNQLVANTNATPRYDYFGNTSLKSKTVLNKIASLYELIITDTERAEREIDSLKRQIEKQDNHELILDVLLLEAEMYRSKGDFVHMKLSYYQGLSWKNKKTALYYKLFLNYFSAINDEVKGDLVKEHAKLYYILSQAHKKKFYFLEATVHRALGKFCRDKDKFELANEHLKKSRILFEQLGYEVLTFDLGIRQGITFYWQKKYQKASLFFHQSEEFARKRGFKKCQANAIISLAEANLYNPNQLDSVLYFLKEFETLKNDADIRDVLNYYWTKEHYYAQLNQMDSSYYYLNKLVEIDEKIRGKMNLATNTEIDLVFKKLQNERKLRDESNTQKNIKLVFGFIGLFLLASLLVLWLILKEKSRYNFVLMSQKDEILHKKKQIDLALKEKELLLKEIHHRVKNNLQIISSLLSLQSKNIQDDAAKQAILEGKERIQAIALIHQKLYQDDTFASIEMSDYLGDLIEQLSKSYNNHLNQIKFSLITNDIILNIDTVVPLGLIICELTTNAFKYAFDEKKVGKLKIEIRKGIDQDYELLVKDNGRGMKEDFDFLNSETLGVEIVRALTDQLDGTISYKTSENGTSILISFKEAHIS